MAERTCPDRRDLERLVLGLVCGPEADVLEEHFAGCGHCLAKVRALEGHDELVSTLETGQRDEPTLLVAPALLNRLFRLPAGDPDAPPEPSSASLDPPREPGEIGRLGPYSVRQVLGEGGMGIVYLARHTRLKRLVALKMLRDGAGRSRERLSRFRREAEVLSRLQHPNIVQILDVGESVGRPYLVMEHVEGGSLAQRLTSGPLPARQAAELLETVARAVEAAHRAGVVHRDLKPGNILLQRGSTAENAENAEKTEKTTTRVQKTAGGSSSSTLPCSSSALSAFSAVNLLPKLTDFGLAKEFGEAAEGSVTGYETRSGAVLGTPAYMAPELTGGRPDASGPACDVYALGAILYECLTGRPPFQAASLLETLERVRTQEPVAPRRLQPGLPRDLETICLKCLHKDPRRRFASARELADDLRRFLDGGPVRARPTPLRERVARWVRRRVALTALLAVAATSLVALVAGAVLYERQLQRALGRAEANRERADTNYRSAREAMTRMLSRARDQRRADLPRLKELRREQQEDAVAFFLGIANQHGDAPEVRADAAQACREAGLLQIELGRGDDARQSMARAQQMFAALAAEFPHERSYRLGLAAAHVGLWACDLKHPEAEQHLKESLALREALVQEEPDSVEYRTALSESLHNLGHAHYVLDRLDEAEEYWNRSIALKEGLQREQPESREQRMRLAITQVNLSVLLQARKGRKADAQRFHDEAEAHLVRLQEQDGRDYEVLAHLAVLRNNWAYMLQAWGQAARAEEDLGKNVTLLTAALRQEPEDARMRDALYRSHGVRAGLRGAANRWTDAVEDWRKVVAFAPDEATANHQRLLLAMALARARNHAAAMAEVEALAVQKQHAALASLLFLGRVCACAAGAAADDASLSAAERAERAERCAARSLALLTRARDAAGREGWRSLVPQLRKDDAYSPLSGRADFQQLLAD